MRIEIEKKYRLTRKEHERLIRRLRECSAMAVGEDVEENTLYAGGNLHLGKQTLRLRRIGGRAILTYKERFASTSAIKHQREDETGVEDAQALASILEALGYQPVLIYEKRRVTWRLKGAEVVIDELPFGLFAEIEGEENAIFEVEEQLGLADVEAEMATYSELTRRHGEKRGDVVEARFQMTLPEII
jgi:adenylate cyclase class 2